MKRFEAKLLQVEDHVDGFKGEFNKEKENVGRLEMNNLRNNEEFK